MAQKCTWHGNEEQRDSTVYHMLQSYGVQSRNYLKIEVNQNSSTRPQKSYIDFEILGSIFLKLDYHQCLKYIYLPLGKSRQLKEFNMLFLLLKIMLLEEELIQRSGFTS